MSLQDVQTLTAWDFPLNPLFDSKSACLYEGINEMEAYEACEPEGLLAAEMAGLDSIFWSTELTRKDGWVLGGFGGISSEDAGDKTLLYTPFLPIARTENININERKW
jgi:hypothetical protein